MTHFSLSLRPRTRSWKLRVRRPIALVGVAILAVGTMAGVAGASGSTTDVSFIALSPAKAVLTNTTIAANKTNSPVVIGGTTTVPSNATTVELTVTAKGASIGTLHFYPAFNSAGGSGQTLNYPGSNVAATATIQENVGQGGALTILNSGIGSAVVTAKIIGYSTQVTAGDINGTGGTAGQVLTNDGSGGASWKTPGHAVASNGNYTHVGYYSPTKVDSVTVPAGTYQLTATYNLNSSASDMIVCVLQAPDGYTGQYSYAPLMPWGSTFYGGGSAQMVLTTSGGTINLNCYSSLNSAGGSVQNDTLTATEVGSATGNAVVN